MAVALECLIADAITRWLFGPVKLRSEGTWRDCIAMGSAPGTPVRQKKHPGKPLDLGKMWGMWPRLGGGKAKKLKAEKLKGNRLGGGSEFRFPICDWAGEYPGKETRAKARRREGDARTLGF